MYKFILISENDCTYVSTCIHSLIRTYIFIYIYIYIYIYVCVCVCVCVCALLHIIKSVVLKIMK